MAASLTPQYREAEDRSRAAASLEGRPAALREMLVLLPKPKGTEKLRADHKRRIKELDAAIAAPTKSGGPPDPGHVRHEGADIEDPALHLHKDLAARIKFAPIRGTSAFPGQQVDRSYVPHDQDVVAIHAP